MRFEYRYALTALALSAGLAMSSPAAAAEPGYAISGASQARGKYPHLTVESVSAKLPPAIAAQLPPAGSGRLAMLNLTFRATGGSGELRRLDPADLQVQWADPATGVRGAAPVLGIHLGKDMLTMVGGRGLVISMGSASYELFAIVPKSVRAIDLAQRQPDGSFRPLGKRIGLTAVK